MDVKKFNNWLSTLLQTKGPDLYRMKGILSLRGDPKRHVFQGVHMQPQKLVFAIFFGATLRWRTLGLGLRPKNPR